MANGSVRVKCFGICTHIDPASEDDDHRVILVNAAHPGTHFAHICQLQALAAHRAHLQIDRADIIGEPPARPWFPITYADDKVVSWSLEGVRIRLLHGVKYEGPQPEELACIPSLRDYGSGEREPGPAVTGDDPERTACDFVYARSKIFGATPHPPSPEEPGGAVSAVIVIDTIDEHPTFEVRPFGEGDPVFFSIRSGKTITLSNHPPDTRDPNADQNEDFYFHFLTVMQDVTEGDFPPDARVPTERFTCGIDVGDDHLPYDMTLPDLTTPGCSNSSYP
jgi:hypothetical protein